MGEAFVSLEYAFWMWRAAYIGDMLKRIVAGVSCASVIVQPALAQSIADDGGAREVQPECLCVESHRSGVQNVQPAPPERA